MNIIEIFLSLVIIAILLSNQNKEKSYKLLQTGSRKLILDSSGLIDGRILDIVKAGFVSDEIVVAQFIINELQLLADGHDSHKRERARFGLDVVNELQNIETIKVTIDRSVFSDIPATDDKLVALSKKLHGYLYTTDYNLGKVAAVESVNVLNVNELAQHLRPVALPGESVDVKIVQKGSNPNQGVGYLDDGTMIVVDGAAKYMGKKVTALVERMHQTVAGKMVFARIRHQR